MVTWIAVTPSQVDFIVNPLSVNWRTWIHLNYFNLLIVIMKVYQVNFLVCQVNWRTMSRFLNYNNDIDDSLASRFLSKSKLRKFYYGKLLW